LYLALFLRLKHFEPTGHTLRHTSRIEEESGGDVHKKYRDSVEKGLSGHESDNNGLPPYLLAGTPEEKNWRRSHPNGYDSTNTDTFTTGSTSAHVAAQKGDLEGLTSAVGKKKDVVNEKDENGWTPLHEGARGGHLEIVKYLVASGADANARTSSTGGTALWWAKKEFGAHHPVVQFLEGLGALEAGPEL
jgi:prolyl 4-hydroxylase